MPKKVEHVNRWVSWECNVCGEHHCDKKYAIECENKPIEKVALNTGKGVVINWDIGNIVLADLRDTGYRLGIIVSTKIKKHDIVPVIDFLVSGEEDFDKNDVHYQEVLFVTNEMKERIKKWVKIIEEKEKSDPFKLAKGLLPEMSESEIEKFQQEE